MSSSEKYLITSATGNTGYLIAQQLLEKGCKVRVMSRSNNATIQQLEALGAEVTLGSMSNRLDMQRALLGIQRVYYCYPIVPDLLMATKLFIEVAQQAKIEAVVNMGQYLATLDSHRSKQTQEHKLGYQLLDEANIGAIHLTPGWFAGNVFATSIFITQLGRVPFPIDEGRSPVVSNHDMAAVAVSLLLAPEGHIGKRYQPTGPKSLSLNDMMASFERVLGRKVKTLSMPLSMLFKATTHFGYSAYLASQLKLYIEDFKNDIFNYEPTDVVLQLTGKPAEDFDVTARRYFEELGLIDKTFSGQMEAWKEFMRIGFTKGPSSKEMTIMNG